MGKKFLSLAILLQLATWSTIANAKSGGGKKSSFELSARFAMIYGPGHYTSYSPVTNLQNSIDGNQPGLVGDFEFWKSHFGILLNGEIFTAQINNANYKGKLVNQAFTGAELGYRFLGTGSTGEFLVFAGPGMTYFSDLRAYPPSGTSFDVLRVNVLGAKIGMRGRIPFGKRWHVDLGAAYFAPYTIADYGRSSLNSGATYSLTGTIQIDYRLIGTTSLSLGFFYQTSNLSFTPPGATKSETVQFNMVAPSLSLRFFFSP